MSKKRRASSNVVATLLIFALMVAAMGVLYGRIAPSILGFDAEVKTRNQEFVMISIGDAVKELSASVEDSQSRISILSNGAIYSTNAGHSLSINVQDLDGVIGSNTLNIGSFTGNISGVFQEFIGTNYYGKIFSEDTFISTNNTQSEVAVFKGEFKSGEALFSMYMRAKLDISNRLPDGSFDITIFMIKFEFQPGFVDFPVQLDEWTLRLRRRASVVTEFTKLLVNGDLQITHTVDGVAKTAYSFPALQGEQIQLRFIEIPILFTI